MALTRNPVLLNLLNSVRKSDKMLGMPRYLSFSSSCLINSIIHEHPCKNLNMLYHDYEDDEDTFLKYRSCILVYVCDFYPQVTRTPALEYVTSCYGARMFAFKFHPGTGTSITRYI